MAKKEETNDFDKYFKGIDLKGRVSVLESAKTLLKVQNADTDTLAGDDAENTTPLVEAKKQEKV